MGFHRNMKFRHVSKNTIGYNNLLFESKNQGIWIDKTTINYNWFLLSSKVFADNKFTGYGTGDVLLFAFLTIHF